MTQAIPQQIAALKEEINQVSIAISYQEQPPALAPDPQKYPAIGQLESILCQTNGAEQRQQAIALLQADTDAKRDRLKQLEQEQRAAAQRLADGTGQLADAAKAIAQAHESYLKAIARFIQTSDAMNGDRAALGMPPVYALGAVMPIHLQPRLAPFIAQSGGAIVPGTVDFLSSGKYGTIAVNPKYLPSSTKEK
jgi:hypothetical protein